MNFLEILSFVDVLKNAGNLIIDILVFAIVLAIIVAIHEFGHFIFARRGGILCREYAIGFGPVLYKKRKGETFYSLRAIPLGGFCAIAGEEVEEDPFKNVEKIRLEIVDGVIKGFYLFNDDSLKDIPEYTIKEYDIFDANQTGNLYMDVENENGELIHYTVDPQAMLYLNKKDEYQIAPYNRTLNSKSKRRRALVMFGGPLMNFVLALIVFFIVGLFTGFVDYKSTEVSYVQEGSSIYEGGLREGDKIVAFETETLGKQEVSSWTELQEYLDKYRSDNLLDEVIKVTYVNSKNETKTIEATPFIAINNLGIGSDYKHIGSGKVVIKAFGALDESFGSNSELKLNDEIIKIGNEDITSWKQVVRIFKDYNEKESVEMVVLRDGNEVTVNVKPFTKDLMDNQTSLNGDSVPTVQVVLGISPQTKFSLIKSVGYAFTRTGDSFMAVVNTFKLLFNKTVSVTNLSGPIGIFSLTSQARAAGGILYILQLIGLLSVNIGLLNLLPIPALDGGRLVFVGYEAITKKKPNPKVETILITVTMLLLFGLMIIVAFSDIIRLFK